MADPIMPEDVLGWMRKNNWGNHHLQWHFERWWDRFPELHDEFKKRGWKRADRQEGDEGNGLDFLAMHRVMIQMLRTQFPQHSDLFVGWGRPPTDPQDPQNPLPDPLPKGMEPTFSQDMIVAIDRLHDEIDSFATDDAFGKYIQTQRDSEEKGAGIHGYLHSRWTEQGSPVNLSQPDLNLGNQIFWRLHGWIDGRWSAFRAAKKLPDDEPAYVEALAAAHHMMTAHAHLFAFVQPLDLSPAVRAKVQALTTGQPL